jgi:hypothetical protein
LSVTTGTGGETGSRQSERVANIIYHADRGDIGRQVDSPTRSVRVCLYTKIDTMEIWTKYIEWTGIESQERNSFVKGKAGQGVACK